MNDMTRAKSSLSVGEYLAGLARANDTDHVFFVDAILRRTLAIMLENGVQPVLCHSEKAAAYMADGFARTRRGLGMAMAQSVGAANLAAGLQDARLFGSPVLAMTGHHKPVNQYRNAYQELPHQEIYAPFVKASYRIDDLDQIEHVMPLSVRRAMASPQMPVHVDVPGNTGMDTDMGERQCSAIDPRTLALPSLSLASEVQISAVSRLIESARRPLLVIGARAYMADIRSEIARFVERTGCGVAATLDGKSCFNNHGRSYLGIIGTYCCHSANKAAAEADLVVYLGCDMSDQITNNYQVPSSGQNVRIVQIDTIADDLSLNRPCDAAIVGDLGDCLARLSEKASAGRTEEWLERLDTLNSEWSALVNEFVYADNEGINVARLLREIENWLPSNAILVADTGFSSQWSGTMMRLPEGADYMRAAGSLGWGFPAALGAKCAAPERTVVCFTGDGGFFYHLSEMETAARRGIKTITIVNNNARLLQGQINLARSASGITERADELAAFRRTDFAAMAQTFGCKGIHVEDAGEIRLALDTALDADTPVIIDIVTNAEQLCPQPWAP